MFNISNVKLCVMNTLCDKSVCNSAYFVTLTKIILVNIPIAIKFEDTLFEIIGLID